MRTLPQDVVLLFTRHRIRSHSRSAFVCVCVCVCVYLNACLCAVLMCFNLRCSCNANPELSSTRNHVLSGNENAFSSHLQFWHFQIEFVIELVASNYHFGQREMQLQLLMSPSKLASYYALINTTE